MQGPGVIIFPKFSHIGSKKVGSTLVQCTYVEVVKFSQFFRSCNNTSLYSMRVESLRVGFSLEPPPLVSFEACSESDSKMFKCSLNIFTR